MNKKQYSIIFGLSLAIAAVSIVSMQNTQSEVLAIGLIYPSESARPTPPSITLGEHGAISSKTPQSLEFSDIRMNGKEISYLESRESGTTTYQYFGTDFPINSKTKPTEFMESGGIVVETRELRILKYLIQHLQTHLTLKMSGL